MVLGLTRWNKLLELKYWLDFLSHFRTLRLLFWSNLLSVCFLNSRPTLCRACYPQSTYIDTPATLANQLPSLNIQNNPNNENI